MSASRRGSCLGLLWGRERIRALLSDEGPGERSFRASSSASLDGDILQDQDPRLKAAAGVTLRTLVRDLGMPRGCRVQVALEDPVCWSSLLKAEKGLRKKDGLPRFAAWQAEKELGQRQGSLAVQAQDMGRESGEDLVLASALRKPALEAVLEALDRAGLRASCLDAARTFRFNALHDRLDPEGALLSLDPEFWSVLAWDAERRPRLFRSSRVAPREENGGLERALNEMERLVRSYSAQDRSRGIRSLYLLASSPAREALSALAAGSGLPAFRAFGPEDLMRELPSGGEKTLPPSLVAAGIPR